MLLRTFEPLYMILSYTNKIQNSVQTANHQEVTSIIFIVTFLFSNCKEYTCSTELYPLQRTILKSWPVCSLRTILLNVSPH